MLAITAEMPQAYWDAFLLQRFPGKTLDELDNMDWGRLMRALQVQRIDQVEELRTQYLRGKYKPTYDDMREIGRHDDLLRSIDG